jgi:hypothetical protein
MTPEPLDTPHGVVVDRSMMHRVALSLPLIGTVGVLVLIGFKLGPWLPLGVAVFTLLSLAAAQRLARPPRHLAGDPSAAQRWRDERGDKFGRFLAAMTGAWLSVSVVLLTLMIVLALLAR